MQVLHSHTANMTQEELSSYMRAYQSIERRISTWMPSTELPLRVDWDERGSLQLTVANAAEVTPELRVLCDACSELQDLSTTIQDADASVLHGIECPAGFSVLMGDVPVTVSHAMHHIHGICNLLQAWLSVDVHNAASTNRVETSTQIGDSPTCPAKRMIAVTERAPDHTKCSVAKDFLGEMMRELCYCVLAALAAIDPGRLEGQHRIEYFGGQHAQASKESTLLTFIEMAHRLQVDAVELLDMETFVRQHRNREEMQRDFVHKVISEGSEYRNGAIVVIDLDSIASVTKRFDSLTEEKASEVLSTSRRDFHRDLEWDMDVSDQEADAPFSYAEQRAEVVSFLLEKIRSTPNPQKPLWVCVLSSEPFLVSRVKQQFSVAEWPLTPREEEMLAARRLGNREHECKRCHLMYREKDNVVGDCRAAHRSVIGWRKSRDEDSAPDLTEFPNVDELARYLHGLDAHAPWDNWRWLCCSAGPHGSGCLPAPHVSA